MQGTGTDVGPSDAARVAALHVLREELMRRHERQLAAAATLDSKAMAVSGFVLAGVPLLLAQDRVNWWFGGAALGLAAVSLVSMVVAFRPRKFTEIPSPDALLDFYGGADERTILGALVGTHRRILVQNAQVHARKVVAWQVGTWSLLAAVILAAAALKLGS